MSAAANLPLDALPPFIKVAALLATGCAVHRSLSPPNPPAPPKTCIDNRTLYERAIRHVTFCSKVGRISLLALSPALRVPASAPATSRLRGPRACRDGRMEGKRTG